MCYHYRENEELKQHKKQALDKLINIQCEQFGGQKNYYKFIKKAIHSV